MSPPRLFVSDPVAGHSRVELSTQQAHYLGRVLRMRTGDKLIVFDGSGHEFPAVVAEFGRNHAILDVAEGIERNVESPLQVRLVLSVSKGERMDFAIQKATELGVTEIQPVASERTVVRLDEQRAKRRGQHWQRIAASACEQCGRNRVPSVLEVQPLRDFLSKASDARLRIVFSPDADAALSSLEPAGNGLIEVLVGPEGGLTAEETGTAIESGFQACTMGPRILRAETAGMIALAILQSQWGDLRRTD